MIRSLHLKNAGPFRGEHRLELGPKAYAITARYESDPGVTRVVTCSHGRAKTRIRTTRTASSALRSLGWNEAAMRRSEPHRVGAIRGARCPGLQSVARELRRVLGGHGRAALEGTFVGANRQREGLRARQCAVGIALRSESKQAVESHDRIPRSCAVPHRLGGGVQDRSITSSMAAEGMGHRTRAHNAHTKECTS